MIDLSRIQDKLRSGGLLVIALVALAIVLALNPAKIGLMVWGVAKLALGGYAGYWIYRVVFRDRLHLAEGEDARSIRIARAVCVAAGILGLTLGVR